MAGSRPAQTRRSALTRIASACMERLPVDEVTIAIAGAAGQWGTAYATSEVVGRLEDFAFASGEGPCIDVLREHIALSLIDLRASIAATRWPAWTGVALASDVLAVHALPVQAGAITAGTLTLYARQPLALNSVQSAVALRLAEDVFRGLIDVMSGILVDGAEPGPIDPADSSMLRADVHRAAGMVMGQTGLPIQHALARLRAAAFAANRPVAEVAADVLAGRHRFHADGGPAE